jgi:hypothetical protein
MTGKHNGLEVDLPVKDERKPSPMQVEHFAVGAGHLDVGGKARRLGSTVGVSVALAFPEGEAPSAGRHTRVQKRHLGEGTLASQGSLDSPICELCLMRDPVSKSKSVRAKSSRARGVSRFNRNEAVQIYRRSCGLAGRAH